MSLNSSAAAMVLKHGLRHSLISITNLENDFPRAVVGTITLIKRDQCATLAALVLHALGREGDFIGAEDETRQATHNLLEFLYLENKITANESSCSHVEPGCFEHGVVHVYLNDGLKSRGWLEIDPVSGVISLY